MDALISFFNVVRGRAVGFRFLDERDYCSDMPNYITEVGNGLAEDTLPLAGVLTPMPCQNTVTCTDVGDGVTTTFQLIKRYSVTGTSLTFDKIIKKPVSTAVRVYVNSVEQTAGVNYSLDSTTGIVTFTQAPAVSAAVTADFLYDIPARFDTDDFAGQLRNFALSSWRAITIVEERLP